MRNARGKQTILLVDGDHQRRQQLEEVLQSAFRVTVALDGEMAVDILRSNQDFAAILLQCRLFSFSGFDVLSYLHTNRTLQSIPAMAMGEAGDELKALSLGAVSFIEASRDPHMLCCQVQNLVGLIKKDRDSDALTGVLQWEPFLKKTRELLQEAAEEAEASPQAMVFLNVDRFKVFNDLFGRSVGDQLLRHLAARLLVLRGVDCVGRVGGGRFVLLCRMDDLNLNHFDQLGVELMRRMHMKYGLHICCGVYEIDDLTLPVGELCDRAQLAQETICGRNDLTVAFYDETLRQNLRWEQEVVSGMDEALEQRQFQVYLQPIFSLTSNAPVSAEALVRWIHPRQGEIPPDRFIPIFERNGFIMQLDQYVWEQVFQYLAEFQKNGYAGLTISANMSRIDIYNTDVCNLLTEMAEKYGVDPASFHIEVTESAYMDNPRKLLDMIRQLNAAGFKVMIDDFGSGYSSLNMLMDMPVSTLKMDMSLIRGIGGDERNNCVVSSVLRMAKWLEMGVVAEGVESQVHVDFLRGIGCDRVQGYYLSHPLPKEKFVRLLERYRSTPIRDDEQVFDKTADTRAVWGAVTAYDRMLQGRMDAAALYEQCGDVVEILCVNDSYYKLMESTPERLFRSSQMATVWLWEEDRPKFLKALDDAAETGKRQELIVRRYMDVERSKGLMLSVCYMGRKDNRKLFLTLLRDISILNLATKPEKPRAVLPAQAPQDIKRQKRRKILVVEDNQVNRMLLQKLLSQDYAVLEAPDGKTGLELLRHGADVDAVLLDLIMPIMDGYDFLTEKARSPELREIPVLVLSQTENKTAEERAVKLGASGFIHKPYDPENLRRKLDSLVQRS